jgi:uncharacterized protein
MSVSEQICAIDRLSPARRPDDDLAGYQRWRSLLFLHWPISAEALRSRVPETLSLDTHDGLAYVGLVPFAMEGVRPRWWPHWSGLRFLETNVRTYVHYQGRPGVYFFSLDANSLPAVMGARARWGLPYYHSRMMLSRDGGRITYRMQRRRSAARLHVVYEPDEWLGPSRPDTLDHFLVERYLLFVQRGNRLWCGQVHHEPYAVQRVRVMQSDETLLEAAGLPAGEGPPLAHFVRGVDVEVFRLTPAGPPPVRR